MPSQHLPFRESVAPAPVCTPEIKTGMLADLDECMEGSVSAEERCFQGTVLEKYFKPILLMIELLVYRCCDCDDFPHRQPRQKQITWIAKHLTERILAVAASRSLNDEEKRAITEGTPLIISYVVKEAELTRN